MSELRSGFPLLLQQFNALLAKNMRLSLRNKKATILQLISPLFFIMLIFLIDRTKVAKDSMKSDAKRSKDPSTLHYASIPPCETKFAIREPCYDFVWSGDNNNPNLRNIVNGIMKNNPGREIPQNKVKSFKDKAEVDDWLYNNTLSCPGAIHFMEKSKSIISYGIQTNSTAVELRGRREDPTTSFQIPLQLNVEREIARFLLGDPNFSWNVAFKEFARPANPEASSVGGIGSVFFLAITMFNFVLQISALVTENELKLRQAMNMMGLYDTAYWLSWLIWETLMITISSLVIILFGMIFQFPFFLKNNFGVLFFLFFLFQFSMTGLAFWISTLLSKSSSATRVGFLIFLIGFVTQIATVLGFPYGLSKEIREMGPLWSLFPPNPFSKALMVLSSAVSTAEGGGVRWSDRGKCPTEQPDCGLTISDAYGWLLGTFFLWFVLALYFDNIIPNSAGLRKSKLYFLSIGYWTGRGEQKMKEGGNCCKGKQHHQECVVQPPDDEDVREEEEAVKQQVAEGVVDDNVAVQIRGLIKTYPGVTKMGGGCCCCCKLKKTAPYSAVRGLWVNFEKDQLFCLLGPNGAGKTTTISCLTGLAPITDGDALIYGHSVRSSTGMARIQKIIGVCPQFDILWDRLSGEEHLRIFALLKGLPASSIESTVETLLAEVQLSESAKVRAGSYSGGMKRRISVAIALIGDPKLVILDEPTTGMDPITRRHVWDVIERAKKGRSIVLTTHSMEEADILSDRIAIVAKGRLRCIGTSIRLKSRFGAGFIATISFKGNNVDLFSSDHHEALKHFFKKHLDVKPKEENNSFQTYVIPHEKEDYLTEFFANLQDREEEFGISDIQIGLTTLEDVFLNIARQAELESAAAEGRITTLHLTSGETAEIPVGARYVGIPGTECEEFPSGFMVEVYWEQDENGSLCIGSHSEKIALPPGVQLPAPPPEGSVHGVVINPSPVNGAKFR